MKVAIHTHKLHIVSQFGNIGVAQQVASGLRSVMIDETVTHNKIIETSYANKAMAQVMQALHTIRHINTTMQDKVVK